MTPAENDSFFYHSNNASFNQLTSRSFVSPVQGATTVATGPAQRYMNEALAMATEVRGEIILELVMGEAGIIKISRNRHGM